MYFNTRPFIIIFIYYSYTRDDEPEHATLRHATYLPEEEGEDVLITAERPLPHQGEEPASQAYTRGCSRTVVLDVQVVGKLIAL